jgi:epoxyqueuosine reductase QueG
MSDATFTELVKAEARRLGAHLVGVAPVSRWAKAPIEHSPQGIYPQARSVVVCALHFLDAPTELGAEADPRNPGPAMTEMNVSAHLHGIAFGLAKFLQAQGHGAMFVRQSGAWRYRSAGGDRGWVGDICHYYAAVCAGLGEVGWNNITLTPQFGPRQRFVSIITEADLTPTPMYDGPALCDRCKLCAKNCPTQSFTKDVSGAMRHIEVEGRRYEFPDRNLWRCAIGENFMLDVFLQKWKDTVVDEKLIVEMEEQAVRQHNEWITGWKMGMCLKHCMPPSRRYFDRNYCKAPRRRRDVTADPTAANVRKMLDEIVAKSPAWGVDMVGAMPAADFAAAGIDLGKYMPDAAGAVIIGLGYPANCQLNIDYHAARAEIEVGMIMQEGYGFSALPRWGGDDAQAAIACGLARAATAAEAAAGEAGSNPNYSLRMVAGPTVAMSDRFGRRQVWRTIVTSAPTPKLATTVSAPPAPGKPADLAAAIRAAAKQAGADLVGIAPAARIADAAASLRELFADPNYFVADDQGFKVNVTNLWGGQGWPMNPQAKKVSLEPKSPADHLAGAKSVIVIGVGLLDASIDEVGKPPARKAGHFHSSCHEEIFSQLSTVMLKVARLLETAGYKSAAVRDLCGLASRVAGGDVDFTASRFAAVAAGLGEIGMHGFVLTPAFGARQRFACIVTDAELLADDVYSGPALCKRCGQCVAACPMAAIDKTSQMSVAIGGRKFSWNRLDRLRCDFAQRYGLTDTEGGQFIGCQNHFQPPQKITPENLCEMIRSADRIQRPAYTPTVEGCFVACGAHRK